MNGRSVSFHTLGCKVNQYETEAIRERFLERGFVEVPEGERADVYVINTCTVTNLADRKSRQYIRRARSLNPEGVIAVTGCYVQVKKEDVLGMEEVDIVTGTDMKMQLVDMVTERLAGETCESSAAVKEYAQLTGYEDLGIIREMGDRTRAFIKIQEGCDRFCSYCIIPYARGKVRSRDEDEIVREAKGLIAKGYREIVLTGINTALYGRERGDGLDSLIAELDSLPGDFRIRLSSLEPAVVDRDYVGKLLPFEKLCHHLHLSIQSGSDSVLGRMNRPYTRSDYLGIIEVLKEFDPDYGISTDIICGFPGETEEEFRDSLKLLREAGFVRVHPFRFSPRSGTKAFGMKDQVPAGVKNERAERLLSEASESTARFLEGSLGKVRRVLTEEEDSGVITGYTDSYIKVYIKVCEGLDIGLNEFYDVRLDEIYEDGILGVALPGERR